MNRAKLKFILVLLIVAAGALISTNCMAAGPAPGEEFSCAADSDVSRTIAAEASLENFSCFVKKWKGADTLHFNVTVKNISSEDQRFKINIFMENGKAVGGLLPRKIKKGLIKPQASATFAYPVKGLDSTAGKIDILVKTMGK